MQSSKLAAHDMQKQNPKTLKRAFLTFYAIWREREREREGGIEGTVCKRVCWQIEFCCQKKQEGNLSY